MKQLCAGMVLWHSDGGVLVVERAFSGSQWAVQRVVEAFGPVHVCLPLSSMYCLAATQCGAACL